MGQRAFSVPRTHINFARLSSPYSFSELSRNTNTWIPFLIQIHNVDYLIPPFQTTIWLHQNQQRQQRPFRKMKESFASTTRCSMRQRSWIQDQQKITRPFSTRFITKDGRTRSVLPWEISEAASSVGTVVLPKLDGTKSSSFLTRKKYRLPIFLPSQSVYPTQQRTCKSLPLFVKHLNDDYIA